MQKKCFEKSSKSAGANGAVAYMPTLSKKKPAPFS